MTTEDQKHNGWTNYETWLVVVWLDNEQGAHAFWEEQALAAIKSRNRFYPGQTAENAARENLTKVLKDEIEENAPVTTGLYADLLSASLQAVNWHEIACHMIDDVTAEAI